MTNWKPQSTYWKDRPSIDGVILIECLAALLVGLAAIWI